MKLYYMQKSAQIKIYKKFLFFIVLVLFGSSVLANENIIQVTGNKNISLKTILSLAPSDIRSSNPAAINNFQKKLFETGFFKNVNIIQKNDLIIINVIENPLINFFYIEGVKNKTVIDKIYEISKVRENSIFQEYKINEDIKKINNYLNSLGYLNNKLNYKVKKISDNKINIFYNIELNNKFKINRIFFIGNKFFKSSTLSNVTYSTEHGWWKFFSNSTIPSESLINYDISRLKKFYLDNGFYDVQIPSASIKIVSDLYANIIFSIESGARYKISSTELIDNSKSLKKENILFFNNKFNDFLKKYYSKIDIDNSLDDFNSYLSKSNFDLNIKIKTEKISSNEIKLTYFVNEKTDKFLIEKITIVGNNITDDFVIRNNLLLSEGDFLNDYKLNTSIEKLKGKGLFQNVTTKKVPINEDKVQLNVIVEEKATGEISAGAGAGTNGATISAAINEKNFIGKGINLNSNINFGTQKILGSISYLDPDFQNSGNTLKALLFAESNDYENASYTNKIIGSSISTSYEIYDKIFLNPGVGIDYDRVDANSDASTIIKKREGSYYTSKFFYNISKNTKNRDIMPTEGHVFGAGQTFSIFSDVPYINNKIFGSVYHEYIDNFIGSIKYKLESINGVNKDVKFSDRLFVGSNNLRGFSNRGIGPKLDNDFIGGNYSFYSSFSSTIPNGMPEKWNATTNIFLDTANVWGVDDNSTDDSNFLRSSIGVGLSWISPLGPLSISYAQPITNKSSDDIEQFNFKIGSAF